MGNKPSSAGQRASDPTARSFSWQAEAGYTQVQHNLNGHGYPQINGAGVNPIMRHYPPGFMDENSNPIHGRHGPPGSPRDKSFGRRSQLIGNGSVVRDDAAFGGVFRAQQEPPQTNFFPSNERTESPESPSKRSRPGTTDSGYFTGLDSDKARNRMRGSRLSLNEAVFEQQQQEIQHMNGFMAGPGARPHFSPPPPPGGFGAQNFHPGPMIIGASFPNDPEGKKAKKWQKKQYKELKKLEKKHRSSHSIGPPPMRFGFMPPAQFHHSNGPPPFRAQSMDNLAAPGLMTNPMPEPIVAHSMHFPPPDIRRRSTSQMDLSSLPPMGPMPPWMRPCQPQQPGQFQPQPMDANSELKKEKNGKVTKSPRGTGKSFQISEKTSLSSAKSSRRSRGGSIPPVEEERPMIQNNKSERTPLVSVNNHSGIATGMSSDKDQQAIYETLKGKQVLATAEIYAFEADQTLVAEAEPIPHSQQSMTFDTIFTAPPTLPTKISPEAQAIMERNAELLDTNSKQDTRKEEQVKLPVLVNHEANREPPVSTSAINVVKSSPAELQDPKELMKPSIPDTAGENQITAILNPTLPRRKAKKPTHFEPLEAWESINVDKELKQRQLNRIDKSAIVDENIEVQLVPAPPSRSEANGELIYGEFNEKLPDFKKRLIETGSFDFPEKFQHSSDRKSESKKEGSFFGSLETEIKVNLEPKEQPDVQQEIESVHVPKMEEREKTNSLRRLKNSFKEMFSRSKSAERVTPHDSPLSPRKNYRPAAAYPDYLYNSTGSLTPSTANIKAGDSSDIDFSWVHDLESKFRREKDYFDSEFEEVQQRSVRRGLHKPTGPVPAPDYYTSGFNGLNRPLRGESLDQQQGPMNQPLNGFSLQEAAAHSTPARNHRVPFVNRNSAQTQITLSRDESFDTDLAITSTIPNGDGNSGAPAKFFGIYEPGPSQPVFNGSMGHKVTHLGTESEFRQQELKQMPTNVRMKAAMFETEPQRTSKEPMMSPRRTNDNRRLYEQQEEDKPYIPQPDYDTESSPKSRPEDQQKINGHERVRDYPSNQLSVETRNQPYRGNSVYRSPRSPSQRIIHRLELQRQQEGWISSETGELSDRSPDDGSSLSGSQRFRYVHDSRLPVYKTGNGYNNGAASSGQMSYQMQNRRSYDPIIDDGFRNSRQYSANVKRQSMDGYGLESKHNGTGHLNGGGANFIYKSQPVLGGGDHWAPR